MGHSCRTLLWVTCRTLQSCQCSPAFRALDTHDLRRGLRGHRTNRALACISRTRHARSPQKAVRAPDKSHSRLHFAHSTRTISAEGCARMGQIALSHAFRALDTHDLRRGLRAHGTNRTLACISHTRRARSPQRVARAPDKSRSRLHFAHSTRTISAEGGAGTGQIALSPAFRALDTHDLCRGLRAHGTNRTLACISRTRHARSPQRVARAWDKSHSRLHVAHSTRTISAEGCAVPGTGQIALSPAFRALDTHDLRRGWCGHRTNRTLACISRTRQRVARAWDKSHSRLHFVHSTRTISAEGCARMGQIALSPAFRTLDAHDLRRGLRVKSPKRAFRTRLPEKLTRQSLQNKRFVRDFLQKASGNTHRSTHITQPCQAVSRFQPLQTTSAHTPIPMSPLPQLTTSPFPAPATNLSASTPLTRTKYCACHEMSPPSHLATSRFPAPATRIALPRLKTRTKSCACHEK